MAVNPIPPQNSTPGFFFSHKRSFKQSQHRYQSGLIYDPEAVSKVTAFAQGKKDAWAETSISKESNDLHSRSYSNLAAMKEAMNRTENQGMFGGKSEYSRVGEYYKMLSRRGDNADDQDEDVKPRKPHDSTTHLLLPSCSLPSFSHSHAPSLSFYPPVSDLIKPTHFSRPPSKTRSRANSFDPESPLVYFSAAHKSTVNSVISSEDWTISAGSDYRIAVWKTKLFAFGDANPQISVQTAHKRSVSGVCWLSEGQLFVSAGNDLRLKTWKLNNGRPTLESTLKAGDSPISRVLSPSPKLLVSGHYSGSLQIWDVETQRAISQEWGEHRTGITGLERQSQSGILSSAGDGSVKLWDLRNKRSIASFEGHLGVVRAICMWDEHCFYSAGEDCTLKKWDFRTTSILQSSVTKEEIAALHRFHMSLITAGSTIQVWGARAQLSGHKSSVKTVTSTNDWLLAGGSDGCLSVWRL